MLRILLRLAAFLAVAATTTASLAQQRSDSRAATDPDCGYVCVYARSTEPAPADDAATPAREPGADRAATRPDTAPSHVATARAAERRQPSREIRGPSTPSP